MKIIDWMHRKLQKDKVPYKKGAAEDFEENGDYETNKQVEMDNEALLLQLDSTILTIGTFGYCNDHFYNFKEEEELPEVVSSVSLPVKGNSTSIITIADQVNKILKNDKLKLAFTIEEEKVMPVEEEENLSAPLLDKKLEERKTLLDLFKESDDTEKKAAGWGITNACARENEIMLALKKSTCAKNFKGSKSNPKKLLSWRKGENSTNAKTLSRLITKMIRKKIYPEVDDVMMTEKRGPKQQYKDKKENTDELNSLLLRSNLADKISGGGYFSQ